MKEIFAMSLDEVADEIRSHPCQRDRGYAFVSYAYADRATVWPAVLNLQRAGYNIAIDLDPDRRDDGRMHQISALLARNVCRMALCFRSRNWTCRLATLLEVLAMRSLDTTNRHLGEPLRVESIVIEPAPPEPGVIPFDQLSSVQEAYDLLRQGMGDGVCSDCPSERTALLAGLEDWLVDMPPELKTRMRYTRYTGRNILSMIDSTYQDGATEFFPYISRLVANWFTTQDLSADRSRSEIPQLLTQAGVWQANAAPARAAAPNPFGSAPAAPASTEPAPGEPDIALASLDSFRRIADLSDARAQKLLADSYFSSGNAEDAVEWYRKAAEQGLPGALAGLGRCLYYGRGMEKDYKQAVTLFRKAAEAGDPTGTYMLGHCYMRGRGVPQDTREGIRLLQKALDLGEPAAGVDLGNCYFYGNPFPVDKKKARECYRKAAHSGVSKAQRKLADCYLEGIGGTQDPSKAVYWYEKAARSGDLAARVSLGDCYSKGRGTSQDAAKAAYWFKKAARRGEPEGQYRLAECYAKGLGTSQNREEATFWCQKAMSHGHPEAEKLMQKIRSGRIR